jgi:hypothetical protein
LTSSPAKDQLTGSIPRTIRPQWLIPGLNKYNTVAVIPGETESAADAFTYLASDGSAQSNEATVNIAIATVNAPTILSMPPLGASPGFEYGYAALATDADFGDTLTWTLVDAPTDMSVDGSGIVTWTPANEDLGTVRVNLVVTDSDGNTDTQDFVVVVQPPSTMPDILGVLEGDAGDAIDSAGLALGSVTRNFSLTVPQGQAISQSIAGDTQAGAGSFVDYVISLGAPPIFAPNLVNLATTTAMTQLEALGLLLGDVTFANSDANLKGTIVSQATAVGTQLALGDAVDVGVSSGPALKVSLAEQFAQASSSVPLLVEVFDAAGNLIQALPPLSVIVDALPGAQGTLPAANSNSVATSIDTRGAYSIQVNVPGYVEVLY